MCFKYRCVSCKSAKYIYCTEYMHSDQTWCNITTENPWGSRKLRCHTCDTVKGAIHALNVLVFREPYLLTEGMAGAPKKGGWEEEEEEKKTSAGMWEGETNDDDDDSDGGELDGFTKKERARVRAAAEAAVMKRWGLLRAEQSARAHEAGEGGGQGEDREGEGGGGEEVVVEVRVGAPRRT